MTEGLVSELDIKAMLRETSTLIFSKAANV